jgi:hypothetical protein
MGKSSNIYDHGFKGVKASRRPGGALWRLGGHLRRLGAQGGQFFKAEVQRLDAKATPRRRL